MASVLEYGIAVAKLAWRAAKGGSRIIAEHWPRPASKVGVFYDADNISYARFEEVMAAACSIGRVLFVKVYGDASALSSDGWKRVARHYGIEMTVCAGSVKGKNSADIHIAIDAMEVLSQGACTDFVIVSNDSDFSALALRIKQKGCLAHCIGLMETDGRNADAFNSWVLLGSPGGGEPVNTQACAGNMKRKLRDKLVQAVREAADEDGWASGNALGMRLSRVYGVNARSCGYKNLRKMLVAAGCFEFRQLSGGGWAARLRPLP